MNDNYKKAYKEVLEILKFVSKEDVDKIPSDILRIFKEEQDNNYNFILDKNLEFKKQNLLKETKIILAYIYTDFWASKEEKEQIYNIYQEVEKKFKQ